MKKNLIKSLGFAGVVSALTAAYALQPAKTQTDSIYVTAPFKIESIDIKNNTAAVETLDEKYTLEVEYVASVFKDGNGVGDNWTDVEVSEIKEIRVYSEDGEIQAYVDHLDVQEIVHVIEQELRERV